MKTFPGKRCSLTSRLGKRWCPGTFGSVWLPLRLPSLFPIVFACWWGATVPAAAQIDTCGSRLTHAEFVHQSLVQLAGEICGGIDPAQRQNLRLIPATEDSANHRVEKAFAFFLPPAQPGAHVLRYSVYLWNFSLVKKTRNRFLGRFWVLRQLRVGLTITYPSTPLAAGGGAVDFERTYRGWVRAADLDRAQDGEFSFLSIPPASDFVSRWAAPVIVGACLGALTFLFFSVR